VSFSTILASLFFIAVTAIAIAPIIVDGAASVQNNYPSLVVVAVINYVD